MPWWGWMVVGVVLLGAESVVSTEFYLAILGIAAVVVGIIGLAGVTSPAWVQWLTFGLLSVAFIVTFRRRIWSRMAGASGASAPLIGETAVAQHDIAPGAQGQAELRGTVWTIRNVGDTALTDGARARVVDVEGLLLHVRGESS